MRKRKDWTKTHIYWLISKRSENGQSNHNTSREMFERCMRLDVTCEERNGIWDGGSPQKITGVSLRRIVIDSITFMESRKKRGH